MPLRKKKRGQAEMVTLKNPGGVLCEATTEGIPTMRKEKKVRPARSPV